MCMLFDLLLLMAYELNHFQGLDSGDVQVNKSFRNHLSELFNSSHEISEEIVPDMVADGLQDFQRFREGASAPPFEVRVGPRNMNSKVPPIKKGVMAIARYNLFAPIWFDS